MKSTIIVASTNDGSLSNEIVSRLKAKCNSSNKECEVIDLYKDNFNPVMSETQEKLYSKGETDDELVKKYQRIIKDTDELVLVFPLWLNNVPAILKGFFDKVFIKQFAFTEVDNKPKGLLTHIKSGMVVSTSESNNDYIEKELNNPIETVVVRGTLGVCGVENVKYININVENGNKEELLKKYFG